MLWSRRMGKVLMKELDSSVETSEMENTSGRSIKTESPLLQLMSGCPFLFQPALRILASLPLNNARQAEAEPSRVTQFPCPLKPNCLKG